MVGSIFVLAVVVLVAYNDHAKRIVKGSEASYSIYLFVSLDVSVAVLGTWSTSYFMAVTDIGVV